MGRVAGASSALPGCMFFSRKTDRREEAIRKARRMIETCWIDDLVGIRPVLTLVGARVPAVVGSGIRFH